MGKKTTNYGFKKILLIIGLLLLIIILILLAYSAFISKPAQISPTPVPFTLTPTPISYDGTYKGNTGVAGGLADVTINVVGTTMTGSASYKGVVGGSTYTLPATINGTVSTTGVIAGTIGVVGNQHGTAISLSGPTNGQILNGVMNCTFTVSGDAGNYSGQISLTK